MRSRFVILVLLAVSVIPLRSRVNAATASTPVVIELFTSEGCSSCPPADALLADLERSGQVEDTRVIPLGIHVDYWNGPTWTDRFSSHEGSLRQEHYAEQLHLPSPYTPQLVVDGHIDVLGNDRASVLKAIATASYDPKPAQVTLETQAGAVHVDVQGAPAVARVMLAITETNLSTSVRGGENGGRELHHAAVVRLLKSIGTTEAGRFHAAVPLALASDWKRPNLHAIVFVQQEDGRILGAASASVEAR